MVDETPQENSFHTNPNKTLTLKHGEHGGYCAFNVANLVPYQYKIVFNHEDKKAEITISHDKVVYEGNIPIDESADLFFRNVLRKWRDFGKDEDYANARTAALEAGYSESDRLATVIRNLADTRDVWKLVLETIRYEAKSDESERMQHILKMVERTLRLTR